MNWEGILGGLVGSTLTVIATRILDIISQRNANNFQLKKIYFERKLAAAEATISEFYLLSSTLGSLSSLYSLMEEADGREFNGKLFLQSNEIFSRQLTAAGSSVKEARNSFHLFFDMGDKDIWNFETYQKALDGISQVANLDMPMQVAIRFYNENTDPQMEDWHWQQVEKVAKEIKMKIGELSKVFETAKGEMIEQIKSIRSQMKKYE